MVPEVQLMLFKYFFLGSISGFLSSTPLGPINLWVADHKLSKSKGPGLFFFLLAVILVDIAFAGIALWGHFDLLEETSEMRWTGIISAIFTVTLGIILFQRARKPVIHEVAPHPASYIKSFVQGLVLTGMNPAFILFWLFVANQIITNLDQSLAVGELISFLVGVIAGDILWFSFFIWILTHLKKRTQELTLRRIRILVSVILILLGLIGIIKYV